MTESALVLNVDSVSKSYRRRRVLEDISFAIRQGEAVAIAGPNGAGKSTLMGCLTGERIPDSGSIRVCGKDPFKDPVAVAECMGFVPETPFLYGELTIAETIRFVSEVRGLDREVVAQEAGRLLQLFGLSDAEGVLCRELSQGMGRKAAIILALLHQPALLVLDEVFNGLDQRSIDVLLGELQSHRDRGGAILLSSHDLSLLGSLCDRGLLLAPNGWSELTDEAWKRWQEAPDLTWT